MAESRRASDRGNLYEYLQVSPRAEAGVIHAAYRALARQYHPDVNASGQASRMMREINAAYNVLGDADRRARYDAHRARVPMRRVAPRAARVAAMPPARPAPVVARTQSGTRQVVAALVFSLMIVGALVLALVLVVTSLEDRPPNALGAGGGGGRAVALHRP
jgi:DnaJ domain